MGLRSWGVTRSTKPEKKVKRVNSSHLAEEQLAALVEGGLEGEEARLAKEHLARCRTCMSAYADTVRLRQDWRSTTSTPAPSTGWQFGGRRASAFALAASLALLVVAGAWFITGGQDHDPQFGEIQALLDRASHRGLMLPGTAGAAWDPLPLTRTGGFDTAGTADVRQTLKGLKDHPEQGTSAAIEIAGYLALDDLAMADIRTRRELDAGKDDPDLFLVAGILAYRQSRLADAQSHLHRAVLEQPDDPVALFNFALVLSETGSTDQARGLFEDLAARKDLPLASRRAELELVRLRDLH